jgi:predicted Zn finger-like uncharacterized protein
MEVRCANCDKLFRVSDDKITGKGIKFSCSRCGEYVKITRQYFDNYTLSQSTVSALDLFEPKPKPAKAPLSAEAGEVSAEEPIRADDTMGLDFAAPAGYADVAEEPGRVDDAMGMDLASLAGYDDMAKELSRTDDTMGLDFAATADHDEVTEEHPLQFLEPVVVKEEPVLDHQPEIEPEAEVPEGQLLEPKPEAVMEPAREPEVASEPAAQPEAGPTPVREREQVVVAAAAPAPSSSDSASTTVLSKKEPVPTAPQHAAEKTVRKMVPVAVPSHSGKRYAYIVLTLITLCLVVYGIFVYLQSTLQQVQAPTHEMTSIEGLHIENPAGSIETNGDMLITGLIGNSTETEKTGWYVVAEVYDAQGALLSKIRYLNGKQIYSQRDFAVLAKRGVDVQALKKINLQVKGIPVPPKGKVAFEMRYLQPLVGMANFNIAILPYDPVQLYKDIAEEMK